MNTIQTRIHTYYFDLSKPGEAVAWREFSAARRAEGCECFAAISGRPSASARSFDAALRKINGNNIPLETAHLFRNQWNTAPIPGVSDNGLRVFDWARDIVLNKSIMRGHWLEQTDEMRAARAARVLCGYCGTQYHKDTSQRVPGFCTDCLGSEYLKKDELHLLRLRPVAAPLSYRSAPLSDEEASALRPMYVDAQFNGTVTREGVRRAGLRAMVDARLAELPARQAAEREHAAREHAGMSWLLDRGYCGLDNVIYYPHASRFGFGWRAPLSPRELTELQEVLGAEFPYLYEIQTTDRGTLSSGTVA